MQRITSGELETLREGLRLAFERSGVEYGYCCCRCGQRTGIAPHTMRAGTGRGGRTRSGSVRGEPVLWRHGHRRTVNPLTSYFVEDRGHDTPCWVWQRGCNDKGYGLLYLHGKRGYAHRWFYERFVGPIPEGRDLDHKCRTTRCVRPEHLEPVSHAVNMQRGVTTKLTAGQVIEIRRRIVAMEGSKAHRSRLLGVEFGVSAIQIRKVADGRQWRNVSTA